MQVSQTITRGGPRTQIAIPAQGMIEFRDALTDLLEEFGTDDGGFKGDLPDGRYMRVDNKNFYFDIGQNNRGIYMRISEVRMCVFGENARRWKSIDLENRRGGCSGKFLPKRYTPRLEDGAPKYITHSSRVND